MISTDSLRRELEIELAKVKAEEEFTDNELREYFSAVSGGRSLQGRGVLSYDATDLRVNHAKIEKFTPCFEAMVEDSKKLAVQVDDCRLLSDRLSILVRRLDLIQIRAQQALACTEDVINLKDCRIGVEQALLSENIVAAVGFIRQVHDIELQAAKASDDYGAMQKAERDVKLLVQSRFNAAIAESNVNAIISLCPHLQTLGLETEARDTFLAFMETNVFIGVSADISSTDTATDPATAYAQILSNIFNTTCSILQQYLPAIIQGMESSLGDIHFIRRLHGRCEQEAGLVLKRYVKYRNVNDIFVSLKGITSSSLKFATVSADLHMILDELALLIQYCCSYSNYLRQICHGAEHRKRNEHHNQSQAVSATPIQNSIAGTPSVTVFQGSTDFDKMVDELINRYYLEGETWLIQAGIRTTTISKTGSTSTTISLNTTISVEDREKDKSKSSLLLDECFFVQQRCGQRAVATNNIQAACAVLHIIANLLSTTLLNQITEQLTSSSSKVGGVIVEQLSRYHARNNDNQSLESIATARLTKGIQSAISLASSIAIVGTGGGGRDKDDGTETGTVFSTTATTAGDDDDEAFDPWGVASYMEVFNTAELCVRYTERLSRDLSEAGLAVFGSNQSSLDKLRICKDDFESCRNSFLQTLRYGLEQLSSYAQGCMKDILIFTFSTQGPMGGIKFDLLDEQFDNQPALTLLPKSLVTPFETIISICSSTLGESNRDQVVGLLTDACCERLEHFISQTSFRFAGALKFEECVRALTGLFAKYSTVPVRAKFSRLREILLVLTSDVSSAGQLSADGFSLLNVNEIHAFASLRIDFEEGSDS